jgi:hypothetical protein
VALLTVLPDERALAERAAERFVAVGEESTRVAEHTSA